MQKRFASLTIAAAGTLLCGSALLAQARSPRVTFNPRDLSGVWVGSRDGRSVLDQSLVPPMTPSAQAKFDAAVPTIGPRVIAGKENDPILRCNPDGLPKLLGVPQPFEIIHTPNRVIMFFEHNRHWRTIWLDGRKLPEDPDPRWMGYSVGRWEGETLVVDSLGFRDVPWVDFLGHPQSEKMHLVERYHRRSTTEMEIAVTIDDPLSYTRPWVSPPKKFALKPDWELDEHYCVFDEEQAYAEAVRIPAGAPAPKPAER